MFYFFFYVFRKNLKSPLLISMLLFTYLVTLIQSFRWLPKLYLLHGSITSVQSVNFHVCYFIILILWYFFIKIWAAPPSTKFIKLTCVSQQKNVLPTKKSGFWLDQLGNNNRTVVIMRKIKLKFWSSGNKAIHTLVFFLM